MTWGDDGEQHEDMAWWRRRYPATSNNVTIAGCGEAVGDMLMDAAALNLPRATREALSAIAAKCGAGLLRVEARSEYGAARNALLNAIADSGVATTGKFLVHKRIIAAVWPSEERGANAPMRPIDIETTAAEIDAARRGYAQPGKPAEKFRHLLPLALRLLEAGNGCAQIAAWLRERGIAPGLPVGSVRMGLKHTAPDVWAKVRRGR
jgi:hypothetical protein